MRDGTPPQFGRAAGLALCRADRLREPVSVRRMARDRAPSRWRFLVLPWPRWWTGFDLVSNLLGYLPLGVLVFGALVRVGRARRCRHRWRPWVWAQAVSRDGAGPELPARSASLPTSTCCSTASARRPVRRWAALVHGLGFVDRWQTLRERWFIARQRGRADVAPAVAAGAAVSRPRCRWSRTRVCRVLREASGGTGRRQRSCRTGSPRGWWSRPTCNHSRPRSK